MEDYCRLYVGNLAYVAHQTDMEALFASNNISLKNVDISIDPFTRKNSSYCFVDLMLGEDAETAMAVIQGQLVRGRPVKINLTTQKRTRTMRRPTTVYSSTRQLRKITTTNVNDDAYAFDRWPRQDAPQLDRSHR